MGWRQECWIPVPSLLRVGCCLGQGTQRPSSQVSPSVSVRGLTAGEPGRGWGRVGSEAFLGLPPSSRPPPGGGGIRRRRGSPPGRPGEALRTPAPPAGGGAPRRARGRSTPRSGSRPPQPGPGPAEHRIKSLGRKEMSHLPKAVGRPGASAETRPQEPGTMAGSERNVGLAAAALPLRGP